ncbi:MAG: phosphoribosylglycinamide formyltransferase [Planctomycetales bacterium]|nr:phosphoribosylglycinamide formyltransferase [Planctomycetales bacterium]
MPGLHSSSNASEPVRTAGPFSSPTPLAVLLSGSGRTLHNLLRMQSAGELPIDIRQVVSSRQDAGGLKFASDYGIDSRVVSPRQFPSPQQFSEAVFQPFRELGVECVVMAGWLKLLPIPRDFENRVVNIHPALIPAFCGHGYYGHHVHEAALEMGVKLSGCTVHFVDNEYDHGPIILQRPVPVLDNDTPDTLAARVFAEECQALPDALRLLAANGLALRGHVVVRAD